MPRRDGFPTNRELQVDFTSAARDVFVAAAERQLESKIGLMPEFEDKPLDHLYLTVWRRHETAEDSPQAVQSESLQVMPLQMTTANSLRYQQHDKYCRTGNELFRDASDEAIEHYITLARMIGDTVITEDLRFGQLPASAVEADWTAWLRSGRTRHAATFKERAAKQSLVAAKFFVEEAAEYVQSDDFDKPMLLRRIEHAFGFREANPRYDMGHYFDFRISPDLPLNGHESRGFIERYYADMDEKYGYAKQRLERLIDLGGLPIILEDAQARVDSLDRARKNAQRFLSE